jgi:hypothetical protein
MEALLILGGLLLVVAGAVWLVVLAFGTSLLWGVGSLVPPLTLAYIVRHWTTARRAVAFSSLGLIPLIVGFSLLASQDPERVSSIFSLEWLLPEEAQAPRELAFALRGEIDGRPFNPQTGTLIGGVLSLSQGYALFASQEVKIRLGEELRGPLRVDILPQDPNPVPSVEISWLRPEQPLPEARRIEQGYTLHLDLKPVSPNKLAGDIHLVLPAHYGTSISGSIELFTDHLRYRAGQVDLAHDSLDTLAYVAKDHLQRRHATVDVEILSVAPVTFPAQALTIRAEARINGRPAPHELALQKTEPGWVVKDDRYPPLASINAERSSEVAMTTQPMSAAERPATNTDTYFSLERLLAEPARYEQRRVRAYTERGGAAEGRFLGIDGDGNVAIRRLHKGPGEVTYNLAPADVVMVELLAP